MERAAEELDFLEAARLRDKLFELEKKKVIKHDAAVFVQTIYP